MKRGAAELEVLQHLFGSVADEMGIVLRKTAYSANIKERRDYSCAVYDAAGKAVAMGEHMPVHLGAMPLSVEYALQAFKLRPGDVVILNDPFSGGTHLPDITLVSAVFPTRRSGPAFILANRAHHADVGGMSPGSMPLAREIYQEGLRIPPMLLVRQGVVDTDLMRLILANVRTAREREGDLQAQLTSLRRGEARLLEMVASFGQRRLARSVTALQDYSERMMRAQIARVPDGTYDFEDYLDGDGMNPGRIRIALRLTIAGDRAALNFAGSDPQAEGPVNANYAIVVAAAAYVFRCLLREDVPFNAGSLRPITIDAPEGSAVNALPPAAMAAGNVEMSQRITDVLLGALAKALPDRIPAASSGTMNNLSFGGTDTGRKRSFTYYETIAGGMGAGPSHPGQSAVHTHMTNSWNTPVEAFEHEFPVRVRRYAIRAGSGGAGRHPGGDGICRELEFLNAAEVTLLSDRREIPPWGLRGGAPGSCGRNTLLRPGEEVELPGKTRFRVQPGEVLRIETPGGGGWGSETA